METEVTDVADVFRCAVTRDPERRAFRHRGCSPLSVTYVETLGQGVTVASTDGSQMFADSSVAVGAQLICGTYFPFVRYVFLHGDGDSAVG